MYLSCDVCTLSCFSPMCGLSKVTSYTKIIDAVNLLYSCILLIISIHAMHVKVVQVPRSRRYVVFTTFID